MATGAARSRWAVAGLALATVLAAACGQSQQKAATVTGGPQPQGSAVAPATSSPAAAPVRHLPARLVIGSIGVDAPVEAVARDPQNNMAVPAVPSHVAWYSPGPAPGEDGDAVIDGHLDWTTGPAVFWNLSKLHVGDQIQVVAQDGATLRFAVTRAVHVPYTAPPPGLFVPSGPARLTLITCAGAWDKGKRTYQERLVIDSSPV